MGYVESILGDNEHIIMRTRHHWFVIADEIITSTLLAIAILGITVILVKQVQQPLLLLILLLLILPLGRLVTTYLQWWNDRFIVTNRRIVQVMGLFNKHVIDSSLEKVNDVVMDQSFMGRLLGYGTIEILTASEIGVNRLERISDPIEFKTAMLNAKEDMVSDNDMPRLRRAEDEKTITELITELAALRDKGLLTEQEFAAKKSELMSRL